MESIADCPSEDSFVPLSEHQEQTPGTFFGGRPVLHYHCLAAKLVTTADRLRLSPVLAQLHKDTDAGAQVNGSAHTESSEVIIIPDLDIWVTSQYLILYSTSTRRGVRIFYPTIVLHATRRLNIPDLLENELSGLYTQLILKEPSQGPSEEEPISIEMTLVPVSDAESSSNGSTLSNTSEDQVKILYEAVSICTALHPDPVEDDDEDGQDGSLGAGGWITADNAGSYFDEEGQFAGLGENDQVAGSLRPREEQFQAQNGDSGGNNGTADADDEQQETKWRRLD